MNANTSNEEIMASVSKAQLQWRCRRGMLELDLLLREFLQDGYNGLDRRGRATFITLLEYPDAVLLELLMGRATSTDPEIARVVDSIRTSSTH